MMEKIIIESPAFKEGELIPARYTCDGTNLSPALKWSDSPGGTKSFTLISDDPDAPVGVWVHWVVYNIPPDVHELPENVPSTGTLANGAIQGITDFGSIGYGGPCPPSGTHRYYFKLYALDCKLELGPGASKKDVVEVMKGHILAEGQLMGAYRRQR
ncbi:YbhB/YbcL family Raf kinase inhibitor-like protein [Candidatus Latescibacterota bacterium]